MAENAAENMDVYDIVAAALGHCEPLNEQDIEEFDQFLEGSELSAQEREEFLQSVWNIVVAIIDFSFGDHPIQHALNTVEKSTKIDSECDIQSSFMVQSKDRTLTEKYNKAAQ